MTDPAAPEGVTANERAPALDAERLFTTYSGFMYTLVIMAAAIWIVLIGSAIPAVGDTKLGIVGFACGSVFGTALAVWSVGLPAFRYGVDSIDVSKTALGVRGSAVTLVGLVLMSLGWAGVALALVARGCATLGATLEGHAGATDERMVLIIALLLIPLLYLLVRHGLDAIRRINQVAGPSILLFTSVSLALLCWRFGAGALLQANVPADQALTADRMKAFAYALEFGVTMALAWWPYLGGLYRFVKFRRHTVGPIMVGGPLIGNTFSASVAALATVHLGSSDPAVWLVVLAGPAVGSLLVAVVLVTSLPAICMLVFFVATSAQQLRLLSNWSWKSRVLLALAPLTLVAFNTSWTLSHVITVATFGSLVFIVLCGIVLADVWILRRGRIELAHLYVDGPAGRYWYSGGVNWIAMLAIAIGCAGYLYLYDPISLAARSEFRYFGAALPAMAGSALLYVVLMRVFARRSADDSLDANSGKAATVEVGL